MGSIQPWLVENDNFESNRRCEQRAARVARLFACSVDCSSDSSLLHLAYKCTSASHPLVSLAVKVDRTRESELVSGAGNHATFGPIDQRNRII